MMSVIGDSLSSSLPILCCLSITSLFSQRLRALLLSKKGGAAPLSHFRGNVLSLSLFSEMLPVVYILLKCAVSISHIIYDFGFLLLDHSHHLLKQNCMSSFRPVTHEANIFK